MIQTEIDEIFDIIAQKAVVERNRLNSETPLSSLSIASLDMVEIIFALEEKFGIEMPFNANTNMSSFRTLGDLIAVVDEATKKSN